jgi:hypothetical protein
VSTGGAFGGGTRPRANEAGQIAYFDIQTSMIGYDRIPTPDQLAAILDGRDRDGGMVRSNSVFTPDGKSSIEINTDTLK